MGMECWQAVNLGEADCARLVAPVKVIVTETSLKSVTNYVVFYLGLYFDSKVMRLPAPDSDITSAVYRIANSACTLDTTNPHLKASTACKPIKLTIPAEALSIRDFPRNFGDSGVRERFTCSHRAKGIISVGH